LYVAVTFPAPRIINAHFSSFLQLQMLKDTTLAPNFPMDALAELSEGHSGSDLKEMCRNAAMVPVREYVRGTGEDQTLLAKGQLEVSKSCWALFEYFVWMIWDIRVQGFKLRPLALEDFFSHDGTTVLPLDNDRSRLDKDDV